MKKTYNIFDCLENADGRDMERITNKAPELDDKMLERLLDMSERKYNIKKRNETDSEYSDVYQAAAEGVEVYRRPVWFRYAPVAAALVLTFGIAAAGLSILKNRSTVPNVPSVPPVAATSVVTTTDTTDTAVTDTTTVTTDLTSDTTGTAAAENTAAASPAQTTAAGNAASAQTAQDTPAASNLLTEEQCYDVINQEVDETIIFEEIVQVPCSDYLDFSDTFTATAHVEKDVYSDGHAYVDDNDFTIKFVHYTDPKFNTIDDIRNYVISYNERWHNGRFSYINEMFGQTIVPGQVITTDYYIPEKIYVYTVYNGKIYRAISNDLDPQRIEAHADYYTGERMALRWGHDYIRNITDTSFESCRVQEDGNGGYYGRYRYYYYDGSQWKNDLSRERELNDAECRQYIS